MRYILLLMLLLIGVSGRVALAQHDPKADVVLKKSKARVHSLNQISATFVKQLESKGSTQKPLTIQGKIKLKRDKFRIELSDQIVICNGKKMWSYLSEDSEVIVSNYDAEEGFSPARIFSIADGDMNAKFDGAQTVNRIKADKITLLPKRKNTDFFKIEVWIAETTSLPSQMKIWNRNGSVVTYTITNADTQSTLPDNDFSFNEKDYPGVEVIDNTQ